MKEERKKKIWLGRQKELTRILSEAAKAYYSEDREVMSNYEYDNLYDQLKVLEKKTGIILDGSPTNKVGSEVSNVLQKKRHEKPMLSLDKTKDINELKNFIGNRNALLSWKLDGITIVLTYENGYLVEAVTRGNGHIGEIVTDNAKTFVNLPASISYKGRLIIRGEAVISYPDFEEFCEEYKNPRNLCSGSVRQLNPKVTARRHVRFYAFSLVKADGIDFNNSHAKELDWLEEQGFESVEYRIVDKDTISDAVRYFSMAASNYKIPSDGLVVLFDDISYGESLGSTAKFPRNAMAFKWKDEVVNTKLIDVEWRASRTGRINPIAIFSPVEIDGSTVSRASIHNVSIFKSLALGVGDEIGVYKANMIIPQIAYNLTKSNTLNVACRCPSCDHLTITVKDKDAEVLMCKNPACPAKSIKRFAHFVSREALNIEGLSEMTLEKLLAEGLIKELPDIFTLSEKLEGLGLKSAKNLLESIEKSKKTSLYRVIYGLGIPGVGISNAKMICDHYKNGLNSIVGARKEDLMAIEGVGPVLARNVVLYFKDDKNRDILEKILKYVTLENVNETKNILDGTIFVITGNVHMFASRSDLIVDILNKGGKVGSNVTSKTSYLINNNKSSTSTKNKAAKEFNIPIISEEEYLLICG